jgi:hypothetical protein
MRGVQRERLGDERYLLVILVDEDMTRHKEDVGGATLRERNDFFEFWRERKRDGV